MPRLLIINADDLGFAPGVNRGIVEAHEAGTLSSASMMVNTPAFGDAAALVRERVSRLGVGLHLNLVTGTPLSVVSTLADPRTGNFYSLLELARRALGGRISADDVRRVLAGVGPCRRTAAQHRAVHFLPWRCGSKAWRTVD